VGLPFWQTVVAIPTTPTIVDTHGGRKNLEDSSPQKGNRGSKENRHQPRKQPNQPKDPKRSRTDCRKQPNQLEDPKRPSSRQGDALPPHWRAVPELLGEEVLHGRHALVEAVEGLLAPPLEVGKRLVSLI